MAPIRSLTCAMYEGTARWLFPRTSSLTKIGPVPLDHCKAAQLRGKQCLHERAVSSGKVVVRGFGFKSDGRKRATVVQRLLVRNTQRRYGSPSRERLVLRFLQGASRRRRKEGYLARSCKGRLRRGDVEFCLRSLVSMANSGHRGVTVPVLTVRLGPQTASTLSGSSNHSLAVDNFVANRGWPSAIGILPGERSSDGCHDFDVCAVHSRPTFVNDPCTCLAPIFGRTLPAAQAPSSWLINRVQSVQVAYVCLSTQCIVPVLVPHSHFVS